MKKSNVAHEKKRITESAMKGGREIYEKWTAEKFTSRKIVEFAENAANSVRTDRKMTVSCLFALYMRIKDRYASPLNRIIFYFSIRREMYALKRLENALNVTESIQDVHTAIEVDLKTLVERVKIENIGDDVDDTVHGGKHTERPEGMDLDIADKKLDEMANEAQDERLEIDEKSESTDETAQDADSKAFGEENTNDVVANDQQIDNANQNGGVMDNNEVFESNAKGGVSQEQNADNVEIFEVKEEINAPAEASEQFIDTLGQTQAQNNIPVAEEMQTGNNLQQININTVMNNTFTAAEVVVDGGPELMQMAEGQNVFGLNNGQMPENQISQAELDEQEYVDYLRFMQWKENARSGAMERDNVSDIEAHDSSALIIPASEEKNPMPNHLLENAPDYNLDPIPNPVVEPIPDPVPNPIFNQELKPTQKSEPQPEPKPVDKSTENKENRQPIKVDLVSDVDFETATRINTNMSSVSAAHIYEYKASQLKEYIDQLAAEFKFQAPEVLGRPNLEEVYRQSGLVLSV